VIVKAGPALRGSRSHGLLAYLLGEGRHTVHHDPRIVAAWLPVQMLPGQLDMGGRVPCRAGRDARGRSRRHPEVSALAQALDAPVRAVDESQRPERHVWHCIVQNDPRHDPVLSDEQWAGIAAELVEAVGLADCRWVAVRHDDHGIHIAATLVDETGNRARLSFEKKRLNACRVRLEAQHCRRRTDPGTRTGGVAYERHEVERARRERRPAPAKTQLRCAINEACIASTTPAEFAAYLSERGIEVGWRHSTLNAEEITGYKVRLASHTTADGQPVWYKASDIDRSLTWPKIQARWTGVRTEDSTRDRNAAANDYSARLNAVARAIRRNPRLAAGLHGPISDIAAAVAARAASQPTSPNLADSAFWSSRRPGGVGRRRYDHRSSGIAAVARTILTTQGKDLWLAVARSAAGAITATAEVHAMASRRRQAEHALTVAIHLEALAESAEQQSGRPRTGRIQSDLDTNERHPDVRRPDLRRQH
jgi:hypothetical protein